MKVDKQICVINAGIGNVESVINMLRRVGAAPQVTSDPNIVSESNRLILPGVGAFNAGMAALHTHGLPAAIRSASERGTRVLGICLGMQLLFERSEEGQAPGLGIIPGRVERFRFDNPSLKTPHMGWNVVRAVRDSTLFTCADDEQRYYFVHSYHAVCDDPADVTAVTRYGYDFACAVERLSVLGVQFHPEKSHRFGMALLRRFFDA